MRELMSSVEGDVQPATDAEGMSLLRSMRDARDAPAVFKASLAALRAHNPDTVAFACEGVDDKKVYFQWIKNSNIKFGYEFIVCNGKEKVLKFRELLRRDVAGLNKDVYFFVDKDFDGLKGYATGPDVYLTETYSFENVLVTSEVLREILAVDMHCHSEPQIRDSVIEKFDEIYSSFLDVTRAHNHRIYLARRLGINSRPLPDKLNKLATVGLLKVEFAEKSVNEAIVLDREPSQPEIDQHEADFGSLEPRRDYRGKFALLFFARWLELLGRDRNSEESSLFGGVMKPSASATIQYSLDSIASRSLPPYSFKEFIGAISVDKQESASCR
ncbi:DUF4435 domain-containing protein [Zoogloea sp.]|uniref:DUF4435 domain-containing protein n=1 Tax=Zoogloea sp. TaxID=49181 RepID=UPI001AC03CFF|nr:DUF4435 domain-containing protein [Zoogloea sp.]MBN8282490.1 DUF4435 domain-containing protein [Zoogloea sp.]